MIYRKNKLYKWKRKKAIHGDVLSFVRTFTKAARKNKRPPEERMMKGIMRQVERKGLLKEAFKLTWGRPPTPVEIHALRTRTVLVPKKIRSFGRYSLEEEKILLKMLDPRTIMHEWTHRIELSHLNDRKRLEYIQKQDWKQRVESELYGTLAEVAHSIAVAQKKGVVISPVERTSENVLRYGKKSLTPKEKQKLRKEVIRSWMKFFKEFSTPEAVRRIASNKKLSMKEYSAYAQAYGIAYKVLENMLKNP